MAAEDIWLRRSTHPLRVASREAEDRSVQLLLDLLSPAQRALYKTSGYFDVTGGETGRRYRIRRGRQLNVEQLDAHGRCVSYLCFVPSGYLPIGDVMLAQKLALEVCEIDALRVANRVPSSAAALATITW